MRFVTFFMIICVVLVSCAYSNSDAMLAHTWNQGCLISVSAWSVDSNQNAPDWDPHRTDDNSTLTGLYHEVGGNFRGTVNLKGFFTVQPEPTHPNPTYQYTWKIDYTSNTADVDFTNGINLANGSFNTNTGGKQDFSFTQTSVSHTDYSVNMSDWEGKTALIRFSLTCNNERSCGIASVLKKVVFTYSGVRDVTLCCGTLEGGGYRNLSDPGTCEASNGFKTEISYVSSEWNNPNFSFFTTPAAGLGLQTFVFNTGTSYYAHYDGFSAAGNYAVTGKVQDVEGYSVDSMAITAE